ncbi:Pre-mRNA-splicing factor cwf25 [Smittium mucronatum]|uniref:Pre-mRNA-splicing factor cwf25 n=1 Tax=Smittium mucronatum TaxID=133383 RepID=A0A1R0H222_9FUNG|nr:Pre-mRNA-splicing factor cwf25 [Smittium mucronatum]
MGGGDLNLKKSWHPLTFRNQEKIWKLKKNAEAEEKKIEQIQKELHKERQEEEFKKLQESAGIRKASDRLEWMYSAPATNGQKGLGQGLAVDLFEHSNKNANNVRDTQAKIREDPLLSIKKKEREIIQQTLKNPLKMQELSKKRDKTHRSKNSKSDSSKKTKKLKKSRSNSSDSKNFASVSDNINLPAKESNSSRTKNHQKPIYSSERDDRYSKSHRERGRTRSREDRNYSRDYSPKARNETTSRKTSTISRGKDELEIRSGFSSAIIEKKGDQNHRGNGPNFRSKRIENDSYRHSSRNSASRDRSRKFSGNETTSYGAQNNPYNNQKHHNPRNIVNYETKQLSRKERDRRLAEMEDNARSIEENRKVYVDEIRNLERQEEISGLNERVQHSINGTTSKYLSEIDDSAYGQSSSISLQDRLHRNRNFLSRDLAAEE